MSLAYCTVSASFLSQVALWKKHHVVQNHCTKKASATINAAVQV
jgi:hypothetical protein